MKVKLDLLSVSLRMKSGGPAGPGRGRLSLKQLAPRVSYTGGEYTFILATETKTNKSRTIKNINTNISWCNNGLRM